MYRMNGRRINCSWATICCEPQFVSDMSWHVNNSSNGNNLCGKGNWKERKLFFEMFTCNSITIVWIEFRAIFSLLQFVVVYRRLQIICLELLLLLDPHSLADNLMFEFDPSNCDMDCVVKPSPVSESTAIKFNSVPERLGQVLGTKSFL